MDELLKKAAESLSVPRSIQDRLRDHVLGPPNCPNCYNQRDNFVHEECRSEGQCGWKRDYGTHTDAFADPFQAKKDMLQAASVIDGYEEYIRNMGREVARTNELLTKFEAELVRLGVVRKKDV